MNLFSFNMQNAIRAGLGVMIVFMFSYLFGSATFINWGLIFLFFCYFYFAAKRYVCVNDIDKVGFVFVKAFLCWISFEFVRAFVYSEGYWMWKNVVNSLLGMSIFVVVFLAVSPLWLQGIYKIFFKNYLWLVGLAIIFTPAHNPNVLNYLPYSTLLLFWKYIPLKKRYFLLALVMLFFVTQEQRNDAFKMLMAGFIGFSITYFAKKIPLWLIKLTHALLLLLPIVFLITGFLGIFNPFKMDEYIKGDMTREVKNESGENYNDNLKADTRTFIYVNVSYTMDLYDAWIMGRSPAYGDEGPIGMASDIDYETHLRGRYGNEVQIMNILLWYGVIGCVLYFLMYARASFLAIYRSRSIIMKGIGIYVAFLWMWSFIWEITKFEVFFMMNIAFLGVCFSKKYREMTDKDFRQWVLGIFYKKKKTFIV